jgi:uncharacterized protein GlcG (DUF336 family)
MSLTDQAARAIPIKPAATLVRPVGALEQLFYHYSDRNPVHFMMAAEFEAVLDDRDVASALEQVRRRHPLLTVHVENRPGTGLGFYRADNAQPIPLRVTCGEQWQSVAAKEFTRPFDRSAAPLMRATLLVNDPHSAVVLTVDHTIADGMSTVMILSDFLAALNGRPLAALPVPPSQEAMLANTFGAIDQWPKLPLQDPDPRLLTPGSVRAFDGTPTTIHSLSMSVDDTSRLINRCRTERTTVHSAIVTAASRVRSHQRGEDYVRVLSPINFRSLIHAGGACADYFSCVVTGMAPLDGTPFWDQAREATAQFAGARSASGVLASSAAVQQAMNLDADTTAAEEVFTTALPFDLLITNLGVQDVESSGPIRPTALWAPILESQIAGGAVIGITTYQDVLRMIGCSYAPMAGFLDSVAQTLLNSSI